MRLHSIADIFSRKNGHEPAPSFEVNTLENLDEYHQYVQSMADENARRRDAEFTLAGNSKKIRSSGFCYVCGRNSVFRTDFLYSDPAHAYKGKQMPNWREQVICRRCHLNGRVRSAIHFLEEELSAGPDHTVYATEQFTPLYHYLQNRFTYLYGSEYLGSRVPYGKIDPGTGVRNESLGKLTFPDEFFDFILCFDVLEHILPPEYHGDPASSEGCLCFYHFGWELMAQLRSIGFENVTATLLWSDRLAYLGNNQLLFTANKPCNDAPQSAGSH